jgi:hypothetical protein
MYYVIWTFGGKNFFGSLFANWGSSTFEHFGQMSSVYAEHLPGTLFLDEESEKMVPRRSVNPQIPIWVFFLTISSLKLMR